jgi:MFS family permease
MTSTGSPRSVRPDKVTVIAVWFSINAAVSLFLVAALLFVFPAHDPERGMLIFARFFGGFLFGGFGVLNIAVVVGLLRLREWGRWLAIALAILGLILIPVHTIVGALIIWYLLSDEAKHAFGVAALPEPTPTGTEATPH